MKSYKKYFWDVITKQYADFKGVATRKQYWMFRLFKFIILDIPLFALLWIWSTFVFFRINHGVDMPISPFIVILVGMLFLVFFILLIIAFIPTLAISVKRLHDIKMSGWFMFLYLIPYIGALIIFILHLLPSVTKHNKYITQK